MRRVLTLLLLPPLAACGGDTVAPGTAAFPGPEWPTERAAGEPWGPIQLDEARLRWRMSEEEVLLVHTSFQPGTEYDPISYWRRKPNKDNPYTWGEREEGSWRLRTNASGLRDDEDIALAQPDLRVLVTGDSHTDGVCFNHESYANRLEARLRVARPGEALEVLNAGVGGYSFFHYHAVLRKFLPLRPDVLVIGVYGGNDFLEVLRPHHFFAGTPWPPGMRYYAPRLRAGQEVRGVQGQATVAQAFNQAIYYATNPDQVSKAVARSLEVMDEVQRVCAEHEVRLLTVYIPPPHAVQAAFFDGLFEQVAAVMELEPEHLALDGEMADAVLSGLEQRGVEVLDLRPHFEASEELLYWGSDHHINLRAHVLVAELLEARLGS